MSISGFGKHWLMNCKFLLFIYFELFLNECCFVCPEYDGLRLILCIVQVFKRRLKCFYGNTNIDQNIDSVIIQWERSNMTGISVEVVCFPLKCTAFTLCLDVLGWMLKKTSKHKACLYGSYSERFLI